MPGSKSFAHSKGVMTNIRAVLVPTILLAVAATAACGPRSSDSAEASGASAASAGARPGATPAAQCVPLETRDANAPTQAPAFERQTRTCGLRSDTSGYQVTVLTNKIGRAHV